MVKKCLDIMRKTAEMPLNPFSVGHLLLGMGPARKSGFLSQLDFSLGKTLFLHISRLEVRKVYFSLQLQDPTWCNPVQVLCVMPQSQ